MKYSVLESQAKSIIKQLNTIINKCKKQGIPYRLEVSDSYNKIIELKDHSTISVPVVDIEVELFFIFNGWKCLGCIKQDEDGIQFYFEDTDVLKKYSKETNLFRCDHCHSNRERKAVCVLKHDDGSEKIVGTTCVKDFTRGLDGELILQFNCIERILFEKDHELDCFNEELEDI